MNAEAKKRYKEIDFPYECPLTKRVFDSGKGLSIYVTKTLKMDHSLYYDKYINHRDKSCFFCGDKGEFISISKGYRNLCNNKICVKKSFSSNSVEGIMYRRFVGEEEAKKIFEIENKKNTELVKETQKKRRKEDPLWDKKRSRNCKEFWILKGYSEEESILKVKEVMDEIHKKTFKKFKENPEKYASKYTTKVEYYLERGYSEEEAKVKISERQVTFSLKKCIEKYGEEEGKKVWDERQRKWMDNLNSKSEEEKIEINRKKISGAYYSPISQILFWNLYNIVGNGKVKFAELNNEFHLLNENNLWFSYDYVDMERKKCIEFNGDFWHCNPSNFDHDYIHRVKNKTAREIWEIDETKINLIKKINYDVLVIWESEYRKDTQQTLEKCIKFINE
jgi:hypothetical protein